MPSPLQLQRVIRPGFPRGGASFTGPLDGYTTPFAAWSLYRRLLASYTGPLIRLRRSSGGESDFNADAVTGLLDTAAVSSWGGVATLYLVTEYDQSGNGRNRTQATAGTQPTFTLTGGPASGIPRIDGVDGAKYVQTADFTAYTGNDFTWLAVGNPNATFRSNLWGINSAGSRSDFVGVLSALNENALRINGTYALLVTATSTAWRVQTVKRATNSLRGCFDGTGGTGTNSTALDVVRYRSGAYYTTEAVVWHSALSDANQDALHAAVRTAYSL